MIKMARWSRVVWTFDPCLGVVSVIKIFQEMTHKKYDLKLLGPFFKVLFQRMCLNDFTIVLVIPNDPYILLK